MAVKKNISIGSKIYLPMIKEPFLGTYITKKIVWWIGSMVYMMIFSIHGIVHDPFPMGYSMMNFGTIIHSNEMSGRQPWSPACFAQDTILFNISSTYVNFYDAMDNLSAKDFRQAGLGFWINTPKVGIKVSGVYFNALGIYEEKMAFISIGTSIVPLFSFSVELEGYWIGLVDIEEEVEKLVSGGFSLWKPWKYVSTSFTCKNISLKKASQPGFTQPLTLSMGIHTNPHNFGSQGVIVSYKQGSRKHIQLYFGEEIKIHRTITLGFGMATEPLLIGFGFGFSFPGYGAYSSFVHNTILGWSQGFGMEYQR